jgi:uncharacterized ubiquitin-like protein YukD
MSSLTTRVSLYKPAGGENVNVTTDLDNNYDKIDTNLNFRVAASATARNAISPFWEGLNVRQTDTGTCWVSNGTPPISASWDQLLTSGTYAGAVNVSAAATGTVVFNLRVGAEANNRFQVRGDGQVFWGAGGASAVDVNLYRKDSTTLKTDDNFEVAGALTVTGNANVAGNLNFTANSASINSDLSISTTVASSTTETVIAVYTIPANDAVVGSVYRLTAWGTASTAGTAPTLKFNGRIGGVAGSIFGTTSAFTCTINQVNRVWKAEILYTVLATGVSGSGFANLEVMETQSLSGTANPVSGVNIRMDGSAAQTVDSTAAKDLVLTATWGTSSASNTLTCRGYVAERVA